MLARPIATTLLVGTLAALAPAADPPPLTAAQKLGVVGTYLVDLGQYDKAIDTLTRSVSLDPNDPKVFTARGVAWHKKGEEIKAIADFDEAVRLDPAFALAYYYRARAWLARGQTANGLQDLDTTIRLDPKQHSAFNDRGAIRATRDEWAGVMADYSAAVRVNPTYVQARANRVWLLAACPEAEYRDGLMALADAFYLGELTKWEEPRAWELVALAYAEIGEFDLAVKWQKLVVGHKEHMKRAGDYPREMLKLYESHCPYRSEPRKQRD